MSRTLSAGSYPLAHPVFCMSVAPPRVRDEQDLDAREDVEVLDVGAQQRGAVEPVQEDPRHLREDLLLDLLVERAALVLVDRARGALDERVDGIVLERAEVPRLARVLAPQEPPQHLVGVARAGAPRD